MIILFVSWLQKQGMAPVPTPRKNDADGRSDYLTSPQITSAHFETFVKNFATLEHSYHYHNNKKVSKHAYTLADARYNFRSVYRYFLFALLFVSLLGLEA